MLRNLLGAALVLGCAALTLPASAQSTISRQAGGATRVLPVYNLSSADRTRVTGGNAADVAQGLTVTYGPNRPPARASVRDQMTGVQDQGSRGTCATFTAIGLYEKVLRINLSEQCLVRNASSQDPNWVVDIISYANANGFHRETECPYSSTNRNQVPAGLAAPSVRATQRPTSLPNNNFRSLDDIRGHISAGRAVGISVYVTSDAWFSNTGPAIDVPATRNLCTGGTCPGHAVIVTGYDNNAQTLEFKNSWGTSWRDGGYGRMTYKYFLESFMTGSSARSWAL